MLLAAPGLVAVAHADVQTIGATGYSTYYYAWGGQSRLQISTAPTSPSYAVPEGHNAITAWSTRGGWSSVYTDFRGPVALQVWRPTDTPNRFTLVAQSPLQYLTLDRLNTFTLDAPIIVQPGDVLGTYQAGYHPSARDGTAGDVIGFASVAPGVGTAVNFSTTAGRLMNVSAVVTTVDATATSLASDANPGNFGADVTFTATVTRAPATPPGPAPTGAVRFLDGATLLAEVPLDASGVATFTTSMLTLGPHTLRAEYVPTGTFVGSTSPPLVQNIVFLGSVTIGATGAGSGYSWGGWQSRIQVSSATGAPSYVIPDGMNRIVAWSTQAGAHEVYGVALQVWRPTGATNQFTLVAMSPIQLLTVNQFHQFVLATPLAVQPGDVLGVYQWGHHGEFPAPGGDNVIGWSSGEVAVGATRTFNVYSGALSNVSAMLVHVEVSAATTTALSSDLDPTLAGQPVTLTATVSSPSAGSTPTGAVRFLDGATELGQVTLDATGTATLTTGALGVGAHTLTAEYLPEPGSVFLASSGTTTHAVAKADTITTVAPAGPLTLTDPATPTFIATVTPVAPGAGTRTGSIQFQVDYADDAPDAGYVDVGAAVPLAAGTADAAIALPVTDGGTHAVRAIYSGDDNFTGSTASAVQVTVDKAATTTTLTSSVNPSVYSQPVTFTASVARAADMPPDGMPAGSVVFTAGTAVLGEITLDSDGLATLTTSNLTSGTHTITAEFVPATGSPVLGSSDVLTQTITRASLTTTLTPAGPLILVYPGVQEYTVTLSLDPPATRFPSELTGVLAVSQDGGPWFVPTELPPVRFIGDTVTFTLGLPVNAAGQQHQVQAAVLARATGDRGNYSTSASNIVVVSVDRAPLTVTADDQTMTYGGPVPAFDATVQGLVAPDTFGGLGGSCSAMVDGVAVTASTPAGTYPGAITCTGVNDANYDVTYVAGDLTVDRKALTVTADDTSVQYSDPLPELTVAYDGFVLGEDERVLDGTLVCETDATVTAAGQVLSPAGTYPITCGGLSSTNYDITFHAGTLTVTHEDTVVRLAQNNPHAVAVAGTAKKPVTPEMTFTARIMDAPDGWYGDIGVASPVTLTLGPVSDGGPITVACTVDRVQPATPTEPGFQLVSCAVGPGTPINVYQVTLTVGGASYRGSDSSVLTVYDPTAGGTTGAGVLTNPNTDNLAEVAYAAAYLKNGKTVQGKFLYVSRDSDGEVVHVLKGNVMSTLAITGTTGMVTGKATLDGVGNYTYILTGIDNRTATIPNPLATPDRYGQHVMDTNGTAVSDLTFAPVTVTEGNIYVGK